MSDIADPVAARASAIHVTRLGADLISDVVIASRGGGPVYTGCALRSIDMMRRELDRLERHLLGKPERIEAAPRAA